MRSSILRTLFFLIVCFSQWIGDSIGNSFKARINLLRYLPIYKPLDSSEDRNYRNKTFIDLNLNIRSLDLDFNEGEFKVDGYLTLKWNDQRYKWTSEDFEGINSVELPFSKLWKPELILLNSREERFVYRQVGLVKDNGDIIYLLSIHIRSECRPNFAKFPFGTQTCSIKFGSWTNEHYKVEYKVKNETISYDNFTGHKGWKILATSAEMESTQYPLFEEPLPSVAFNIAFKKEFHFDPTTQTLLKVIN